MTSFRKRVFDNLLANLFGRGTAVITQLTYVPLFLSLWPKQTYGEWLIISALPSYLAMADIGITTYTANEVSMFISVGDLAKARRSIHTAWGFLLGISALTLLISATLSKFVHWPQLLNLSIISDRTAATAITLLSIYTILGLLLGIYEAIYRGYYKNARYVYLTNGGRLLELLAIAICLPFSQSPAVLAGAMLFTRCCTMLIAAVDSSRISQVLRPGISEFSWPELNRTWKASAMFMASTAGNAIYFQGLTLLVGKELGAGRVVIFNTMRALTRAIVQFVTLINISIWPEFSYLYRVGNLAKARRLNQLAFEISCVASIGIGAALYLTAPWIVPLWTNGRVAFDRTLFTLLLASAMLNGIWSVTSAFLMGVNRHVGLMSRYLLAAGLTLVIARVLIHFIGIYGAAAAMICCELALLPYAVTQACRLLNQPLREFFIGAIRFQQTSMFAATEIGRWRERIVG